VCPAPSSTASAINFGIQVTQPLLRGYGKDVTLANIYIARREHRINLAEFRRVVANHAAEIEVAYFNLVLAATDLDIQKRLVTRSLETFNTVMARAQIDATKSSTGLAAYALTTHNVRLSRAFKAYHAASDHLKALMNDPEFDIRSNTLIRAVDLPMTQPVTYDLNESLDTALRQRPDLEQARTQIEIADINVAVARNGLLPQVNATVKAETNGIAGGADGAIGKALTFSRLDLGVGIHMEIPIGNQEAEAIYTRRGLEQKKPLENLMLLAQRAIEEVRVQHYEIIANYQEIRMLEAARSAAARELSGYIEAEDVRKLTPEYLQLKLNSQEKLAAAEQALILSMVNYDLAIVRMERAKGTLLEYDRISLDRPPVQSGEGPDFLRLLGKTWLRQEK
jgi:outer membrane protein